MPRGRTSIAAGHADEGGGVPIAKLGPSVKEKKPKPSSRARRTAMMKDLQAKYTTLTSESQSARVGQGATGHDPHGAPDSFGGGVVGHASVGPASTVRRPKVPGTQAQLKSDRLAHTAQAKHERRLRGARHSPPHCDATPPTHSGSRCHSMWPAHRTPSTAYCTSVTAPSPTIRNRWR